MLKKAREGIPRYLTGKKEAIRDSADCERKEAILRDLSDHFSMRVLREEALSVNT